MSIYNYIDNNMNNKDHYKIHMDGTKQHDEIGCAFVTTHFSWKYHLPNHTSIFTAELYAILKAINYCKSIIVFLWIPSHVGIEMIEKDNLA